MNENSHPFQGKKVLVMGLGLHGGGVSTVKFLTKHGARIMVTDLRNKAELNESLKALMRIKGIRYTLGRHDEEELRRADLIIKNPGVKPNAPYLVRAREMNIPVVSDIGIFFAFCPSTIIGVTGTRGKSTVAYLIWRFLKTKKKRVFLGGNIRKSPLDFLDELRKDDIVVLELSSFQLFDLAHEHLLNRSGRKSPHIAVLTNILCDHLNWHKNMKEYEKAKKGIFQFQSTEDFVFANPGDSLVRRMVKKAPGDVRLPLLPKILQPVVEKNLGMHYRQSVGLAVAVAQHFNVPLPRIAAVLKNFLGLPGRQEHVATVYGIHVVNDTTSTVPDATIAALRRFRPRAGKNRIILIAGGQDKNLDFRALAREIRESADVLILLPGTATEKIKKQLAVGPSSAETRRGHGSWQLAKNEAFSMKSAVKEAFAHAEKGDYVILSPGAASFGLFLNEFDRGKQFMNYVRKLILNI